MLRSTRTVVLLGLAVQIAAFLRTAVIAAALGASLDVDAYNLGLIGPTFISGVIGSWLQLTFIGRYAALIATAETDMAAAYRGLMLYLVLGLAVACAAVCFLLPGQIASLFIPNGQTATIASAADALQLSGLILVPVVFGDFLALVLNSHGRFVAAAIAPLINALVSVLALLAWPSLNLSALIWTLLLGTLAQCLVVVVAVMRMGLTFPVEVGRARQEVGKTLTLALPLVPAVMLSNSAAAIIPLRIAELGEGLVAIYGYSSRLHTALTQALVIGLGTVLLPHFAALWSRGETAEITILFRRLARCSILLAGYLTVGIYLMDETTVRILFERGAFDPQHTRQVSWFWAVLSLSLFPLSFGTFIAKFCQALRGAGSILISGIVSFAATWIVAAIGAALARPGIIIGAAVAAVVGTCIFWLFWLGKRIRIEPVLTDIAAASFRMALALIPAIAVERWIGQHTHNLPDLLSLLVRGALYTLVVLSLLIATRSHLWFLARRPGEAQP